MFGRRERDWIKNDKHCDIFCTLAHTDTIEGRSITDVVMIFGNAEVAARRVRNVFDAHEFERALKAFAAIEADRLENMMHNDRVGRQNGNYGVKRWIISISSSANQ